MMSSHGRRYRALGVGALLLVLGGCPSSPSDRVPPIAASVIVSPRQIELSAIGDTASFTAAVRDPSGNEITGRQVDWTTSEPAVATVDPSGLVTAVGQGTSTVTASSNGLTDNVGVTVTLGGGS